MGDKQVQGNSLQMTIPNESLVLSTDGMFTTIQGEGPRIGRPTTFLRLGGCNLKCSWCDTKYTWDWENYDARKELHPTSIESIAQSIVTQHITSLTITGGEPFLQEKGLRKLFLKIKSQRYIMNEVCFETNGITLPSWDENVWGASLQWGIVVSPKLLNSGNSILETPTNIEKLVWWLMLEEGYDGVSGRPIVDVNFKFVCKSSHDFSEIDRIRELVLESGYSILKNQVWIMPEGTNPERLVARSREMVDEVIAREWNLTPRFHQSLWGNARAK